MSVFKRTDTKSPYYRYEFQIAGRTFKGSTKCTSQREAEAIERDKRREAEAFLALEQLDPARTTVEQVFGRYWTHHGRKLSWAPTLKSHMLELEAFFGPDKPFLDITVADIAAALEDYAQRTDRKNRGGSVRHGQTSDSTVNRRLAVFRGIYIKARDEWEYPVAHIVFKKLQRKEPKERVRHITRQQAKILLKFLEGKPEAWVIVAWSLATGCRKNESRTLTWSRVNFETMQAEVITKGGGTRFVELSTPAINALERCPRDRARPFLFKNLRRIWEAAVKAAGLEDFRFHDLRHTFATWFGNASGDITLVMKQLGHSEIGTTMKYRHVIRADVQREIQKMPTLIDGGKVVSLNERRRVRKRLRGGAEG